MKQGYEALRSGRGAFELGRDVVRVTGPDAEGYLQGQLSQDVAALGEGATAWSLVLHPQGRLVALVRVYRAEGTVFVLDTDAGNGPALVERLLRFKLRTKVEVEQLPWRAVAVRGSATAAPQAPSGEAEPIGAGPVGGAPDEGGFVVPFRWDGLVGYDLIGPAPAVPPGTVAVPAAAYEAVRIEAGFPRQGADIDERTIPAEADLVSEAVSFTKGCYTGQELVARIDSRGANVPRRLRGFLLEGPAEPGAELSSEPSAGSKVAGRLTSVALSPRLGWVALGYAARAVQTGQVVYLDRGALAAEVHALPLVG